MNLLEREAIARKVEQALEGEEYSIIEMAHDLIRLARHPVWEEHDRMAGLLDGGDAGAVGRYEAALREIASGKVDEVLGLTEPPRRGTRRHMMRVAQRALEGGG
jgi:hypothetical protein